MTSSRDTARFRLCRSGILNVWQYDERPNRNGLYVCRHRIPHTSASTQVSAQMSPASAVE